MGTTIQKIVTGKLMEQIFEKNSFIRHYTVSSKVDASNYDGLKKYYFNIRIRHNENENPTELFVDAINKIVSAKKLDIKKTEFEAKRMTRKNGTFLYSKKRQDGKRNTCFISSEEIQTGIDFLVGVFHEENKQLNFNL